MVGRLEIIAAERGATRRVAASSCIIIDPPAVLRKKLVVEFEL